MGWNKASRVPRVRLEETTEPVPLLKDIWVKSKLMLTHIAGIATLVTNLTTESAQNRYAVERVHQAQEALKTAVADLRKELERFRQEMGAV